MQFEYFRNPLAFAYTVKEPTACSICGDIGICLEAGAYSGVNTIKCICETCMKAGSLIELDIESNLVSDYVGEATKTIAYKTPALPTWQDTAWPIVNGEVPVFERIASLEDFEGKADFLDSFIGDQDRSQIEWLWECLPKKRISHYSEAHDISVYLFTLRDNKYWIWDAC